RHSRAAHGDVADAERGGECRHLGRGATPSGDPSRRRRASPLESLLTDWRLRSDAPEFRDAVVELLDERRAVRGAESAPKLGDVLELARGFEVAGEADRLPGGDARLLGLASLRI